MTLSVYSLHGLCLSLETLHGRIEPAVVEYAIEYSTTETISNVSGKSFEAEEDQESG